VGEWVLPRYKLTKDCTQTPLTILLILVEGVWGVLLIKYGRRDIFGFEICFLEDRNIAKNLSAFVQVSLVFKLLYA
jgi:hypothetical protein